MMTTEEQQLREKSDEEMIGGAFQHLIDTYAASRHRQKIDIITKAFNFARQAHKGVRRLSGEPYIMHPIAVAQIACEEVGLGSTSICAALLHDVVEDTDYTTEDIENIFGAKVARIVDGLTKISGGIFGEQASAQAENFKKLLLTMSDDIRVILIKICDRLHNMRTLESQPANKQYKIAGETLYIYAPLANRLGLNKVKTELEDLSFRYEHPADYALIRQKLASTQSSRHELFDLSPNLSKRRSTRWVSATQSRSVSRVHIPSGTRCKTSMSPSRRFTTSLQYASSSPRKTGKTKSTSASRFMWPSVRYISHIPTVCATGSLIPRPMAIRHSMSH